MSATNYKGIDYSGIGATCNRDTKTGIRYGIISQNAIGQAWFDSSEPFYGDPHCPKCGNPVKATRGEYARYEHAKHECPDYVCHSCKYVFGSESAFPDECLGCVVDDGEIKAQSDSSGDIWIFKSQYFTYAQFCSPCAPGACYLDNPLSEPDQNNRAYCFGHDWFDGGKAPYPVYSVESGQLIAPEDQSAS